MKFFLTCILVLISFIKIEAATCNDCDTCFVSYEAFKKMSNDSILNMFSGNDTATTIIHFFIIKKRKHFTAAAISAGATVLGTGASVALADRGPRNETQFLAGLEYILLGLAIFIVGFVVTVIEGLSGFNYTKSALYRELKYFYENKRLSRKLAKKNIFNKKYKISKK